MQLHFKSISEPALAGEKWLKLFETYWPSYDKWLVSKGVSEKPDLKKAQAMLRKYMPEMAATYEHLCRLSGASPRAAYFLTGWCPPAYLHACSQAVYNSDVIQLVRNYDFHPELFEGTLMLSKWNGKKVISNNDCLMGAVDGMNEDGLAISLTFGGRDVVGRGFGIPFILRYVLEFCSNVEEAVEALKRIPSHMSYNITVVDRSGVFKTVMMAPDRKAVVTVDAYTTNHQHRLPWPKNAIFNKTVERSEYLKLILSKKGMNAEKLADAFLRPPLYNSLFKEGFGTLFTSVYRPEEGTVKFRWPKNKMEQSFAVFKEESRLIEFVQAGAPEYQTWVPINADLSAVLSHGGNPVPWQHELAEALIESLAASMPKVKTKQLDILKRNIIQNGQISWKLLATFWNERNSMRWEKWIISPAVSVK
jgi:predicted choloylglycine hydrolase